MYKKHVGMLHIKKKKRKKKKKSNNVTHTKKEREHPRGSRLEKRRQPRERAVHGEENRKESAKYCRL